jgi:hypothetical protein
MRIVYALPVMALAYLGAGALALYSIETPERAPDPVAPASETPPSLSPLPAPDPSTPAGATTSTAALAQQSATASAGSAGGDAVQVGIPGGSVTGGGGLSTANLHLAGPDYQPSLERFLKLGATMQALTLEDLPDDDDFWKRWPQYAHLREDRWASLQDALGVEIDTAAELRAIWQHEGTEALWQAHQLLRWERANLLHVEASAAAQLETIEYQLGTIRRALWQPAGELYLFLFEVDQWNRGGRHDGATDER